MSEVKKILKAEWSVWMTAFLALSAGFFTLVQAPNLYQIVYWRSSMTTHFAPVVYGTFLTAYLFRQANISAQKKISAGAYIAAFILAFVVGGFSEPSVVVMITLLVLSFAAVWRWGAAPSRERVLTLLACVFAAAVASFLVMALSPANSRRLGDDPPGLMLLIHDSFLFGYVFIQKTWSELPLPTILSVAAPALTMALYARVELSPKQARGLWILFAVILFLMYILIVASFSPSVLGQGYPVARVRFYARLIMTLSLMFDGALLGILVSRWVSHPALQWGLLILFFAIGVFYPLRAAKNAYNLIPQYRARAAAWDERDAIIRNMIQQGQTELTVKQFDGVYGTKELDSYETHWVNQCAANYYGAVSIRAIPFK